MLSCQREHFNIAPEVHYLNCAYMSPLAKQVERAGVGGMLAKRTPSEIVADDFFAESDRLREKFARLVGAADSSSIAILPSVSYGTATIAKNLSARPGGRIVVLREQFPSNIYAWRRLELTGQVKLTIVDPPPTPNRVPRWNLEVLRAIVDDTVAVSLPHVHWTDGSLFDLVAVRARCDEVGAALIVDGTQSVGALPFDVQAVRPDALICAGYKWLLGPYSIAVGYFGPRFADGVPIEENWITRAGSEAFDGLVRYTDEYQPGAIRYDVGERSNFILTPMLSAALDLVLEWTPEAIQHYCKTLFEPVLEEASALGFQIEPQSHRASHLFGVRMPPGSESDRLREALRDERISVALRGDAVRISPNVYNDESDASALLAAFRACAPTAAKA